MVTGFVVNFFLPAVTLADPMVNFPGRVASNEYDHVSVEDTSPLMLTILEPRAGPPTTLKSEKFGGVKFKPLAFDNSNWMSNTDCWATFGEETDASNEIVCPRQQSGTTIHTHPATRRTPMLKFPLLT
jgi:hypothetical protein